MDPEMKISAARVRRLRTERGWSQDQLAVASGLSLRTIQRVEAEGAASRETRVSLAATFGVQLSELAGEVAVETVKRERPVQDVGALFIGMAVLTCVLLNESGRLPGLPTSDGYAAIDALLAAVGALLVMPAALRLIAQRHYAGVGLAVLGTPLAVLLVGGLLVAAFSGRAPSWQLGAFGIGGIALIAMAFRQFGRFSRHSAVGRSETFEV